MSRRHWIAVVAMPLLMQGSTSLQAAGLSCEREDVAEFATRAAQRNSLDRAAVCELFGAATVRADVLRLIVPAPVSRPPDWNRYRGNFVNAKRIRQGLEFWDRNRDALDAAAKGSGVPAAVIVALLGVETAYGSNIGRHKAFDTLATLAFEYPPRASFFRDELESLLVLARDQNIPVADIRSSYAGALGMPQFMPGSWRKYAVDGDGDLHIDLWQNPADVVASVANFLARHGWQAGRPTALKASVEGTPDVGGGIKPDTPLVELRQQGVRALGELPDSEPGVLLRYGEGDGAEYWVGLQNFYVITRYNRSSFYAMSVVQLAEALEKAAQPALARQP
ncbi:MAG: lytic murein transglycosylase B [Rhodocyclaceae bacterium]|nr:lytic murein transglycosylase B [Rhodocyclaceae bacterium]